MKPEERGTTNHGDAMAQRTLLSSVKVGMSLQMGAEFLNMLERRLHRLNSDQVDTDE